jgi:hypothetical protein
MAAENLPNGLSLVPDERLPLMSGHSTRRSMACRWGDLFTGRQKLAQALLGRRSFLAESDSHRASCSSLVDAPIRILFVFGRPLRQLSTFGRQAIPMAGTLPSRPFEIKRRLWCNAGNKS